MKLRTSPIVLLASAFLAACGVVTGADGMTPINVGPGEIAGPDGTPVSPGVPLSAAQWGRQGVLFVGPWGLPDPEVPVGMLHCEVDDCDELEAAMRRRLVLAAWREVRERLQSELDAKQAAGGGAGGTAGAGAFAGQGGGASGTGGAGGAPAPAYQPPIRFSVPRSDQGDSEGGDIVKRDGDRLAVLSGRRLSVMRLLPTDQLAEESQLVLDFTPRELYLRGAQVLVIGYSGPGDPRGFFYTDDITTQALLVDVSTPSTPRTVGRWLLPGFPDTSWRTGSLVRVIGATSKRWNGGVLNRLGLPFPWTDRSRLASTPTAALIVKAWEHGRRAEDSLRSLPFAQLFPRPQLFNGQRLEGRGATFLPAGEVGIGELMVSTLELGAPGPARVDMVLLPVAVLYASRQALYVAHGLRHPLGPVPRSVTQLHQFTLTEAPLRHVASGEVPGSVCPSGCLDEHADVLRVFHVATTGHAVSTLHAEGGRLIVKGSSGPRSFGEAIAGVRFVGDAAYVATRHPDTKLYAVDLTDSAQPLAAGSMTVAGLAPYIHPLDDRHLVIVRGVAGSQGGASTQSIELALIDARNLSRLQQTHTETLGEAGASTTARIAAGDVTSFVTGRVLAVPFSRSDRGEYSSDLRVFDVDPVAGFHKRGTLGVDDLVKRAACDWSSTGDPDRCWTWWWSGAVQRTLLLDDSLYAMTSGGVRAAKLETPGEPVATARLPEVY